MTNIVQGLASTIRGVALQEAEADVRRSMFHTWECIHDEVEDALGEVTVDDARIYILAAYDQYASSQSALDLFYAITDDDREELAQRVAVECVGGAS